jgi:type VI protein secretion system component Hcp
MRLRPLVTGAFTSIFAALAIAVPAQGTDYFLEINNIPGESQDAKLPKSVEIESYVWGVSRASGAQPALGDFTVAKRVDVTSPVLFKRLLQGQAIASMELLGRKAGQTEVFLKYCFQNVFVRSIKHSGSDGDDATHEDVTFAYTSVTESYTRQSSEGGLSSTVFAGWNATNATLIQNYPGGCGL